MESLRPIGILAAAAALVTTAVHAQSVKLRQRMVSEAAELIKHADRTNQECGSSVTVTFDWTGVPEEDLPKYSVSGYCDGALGGLRRVCEKPLGKDAVKEKIKSVTCGFGAAREISLKDGALSYKINFSSSNDGDFVYEYLGNAL